MDERWLDESYITERLMEGWMDGCSDGWTGECLLWGHTVFLQQCTNQV